MNKHRTPPHDTGPKARLLIAMGLITWHPHGVYKGWRWLGVGEVATELRGHWAFYGCGSLVGVSLGSEAQGLNLLADLP